MPDPRSLEEWTNQCTHKPALVGVNSWLANLLCYNCASVYARQQAEAMRERAAQILEMWPRDCHCGATDIGVGELHEPGCGLPNPIEVVMAIRALEVPDA